VSDPEDTVCAVLFRETILINYLNSIKIVKAVFEKIATSFLEAHLKGS
jgi:hypothetical protein